MPSDEEDPFERIYGSDGRDSDYETLVNLMYGMNCDLTDDARGIASDMDEIDLINMMNGMNCTDIEPTSDANSAYDRNICFPT